MNGECRFRSAHRDRPGRTGFTLIELLVVMLIMLLVSALVLPTVIPAIAHRQVSEAARILQAALAGARDVALNNNAPAGIRLLPDPVLNGINPTIGALDPARILASNRYVPIQLAPNYSEGFVMANNVPPTFNAGTTFPYWFGYQPGLHQYPVAAGVAGPVLVLSEQVANPTTLLVNPPTSWYWNIRIGDKIQINNMGRFYTVVGPMNVFNSDLFVNAGPPGTVPPLTVYINGYGNTHPEFLFLVNGIDDNGDGYVDNGWDGVDNDGDGYTDQVTNAGKVSEWQVETETWQGPTSALAQSNLPYTITRRPVVSPGSRETLLPSNVVVDLTSWNPGAFGGGFVSERSRLPVDATTGSVDILLNPNGTVVPSTMYSSPSSFGMGAAFYQFWLAERGDLFYPLDQAKVPYLLPMVTGAANYPFQNPPNPGNDTSLRYLKGERRLITLYARTGQMVTNQLEDSSFDGSKPSLPFLLPQQGVRGDMR
jgi:prepilin-type N-terminal cleavage/methylation domain-containing protein